MSFITDLILASDLKPHYATQRRFAPRGFSPIHQLHYATGFKTANAD